MTGTCSSVYYFDNDDLQCVCDREGADKYCSYSVYLSLSYNTFALIATYVHNYYYWYE